MFKKLICLILPLSFVTNAFADETPAPAPTDVIIEDNFYDPDKNVDYPIPHPSDDVEDNNS